LNEWFIEDAPGILRWRKDYFTERNGSVVIARAGEIAGHANNQGRVQINFQGRTYYRSRLIYKLHTRKEPQVLQYLNGNTLDDRFENLKSVTNNAYAAVRDTRDRDQDYFVITSRTGADGRTVKTVTLSWRCGPTEDAEAIAKELNRRCEDYLRDLNREAHEDRLQKLRNITTKEQLGEQLSLLASAVGPEIISIEDVEAA
jgi:hypothetical protein